MTISWLQAALLDCLRVCHPCSRLGGTSIGNYGTPACCGLVSGLILGDIKLGQSVAAMQLVYIALVTPGGTVSADVRAVSYIGIPLAMVAITTIALQPRFSDAANLS